VDGGVVLLVHNVVDAVPVDQQVLLHKRNPNLLRTQL
jgi:hypothetical protein